MKVLHKTSTFLYVNVIILLHLTKIHSDDFPPGTLLVLMVLSEEPTESKTLSDGLDLLPAKSLSNTRPHSLSGDQPTMETEGCSYTSDDAHNLLNVIDKMSSFYAMNVDKIDMRSDGGFGLATLKNQLRNILERHESKLSDELKDNLQALHRKSADLTSQIFEQVLISERSPHNKEGLDVIQKNGHLLEGLGAWNNFGAIKEHFHEFPNIGNENEVIEFFHPKLDFECLTKITKDCSVPQVCKAVYLRDIYSQYMLMHQVLYQEFAESRSCPSTNPEQFQNPQEFRDRLCSKAYLEAEFLEAHNFPMRFLDLFAEQVGMCGLMGYPNFMRSDWLQEILSWHEGSLSGCMPNIYGSLKTTDTIILVPVEGSKDGKSEECLVHFTTVCLMALAMNLRYMVDSCEPELFDAFIFSQSQV